MMKRPSKADKNNAAGLLIEAERLVKKAMDLHIGHDEHLMTVRHMLTIVSIQYAIDCGLNV